jgi:cell division protein FtsB
MIKRYGLLVILVLLLIVLQAQLWFSNNGVKKLVSLKETAAVKQAAADKAQLRNDALIDEVKRIQQSNEEIESHARYDLGMVKPDEEYVQIVPEDQE